jgi:hypothetical protein
MNGSEEKRNAYRLLVGKPERRRSLGRQGLGEWRVNNIKTDLRAIELGEGGID